jgi:hypothetical protein
VYQYVVAYWREVDLWRLGIIAGMEDKCLLVRFFLTITRKYGEVPKASLGVTLSAHSVLCKALCQFYDFGNNFLEDTNQVLISRLGYSISLWIVISIIP